MTHCPNPHPDLTPKPSGPNPLPGSRGPNPWSGPGFGDSGFGRREPGPGCGEAGYAFRFGFGEA